MPKMVLLDHAINEKCCIVEGFFRPHPGGFDSTRVPTPGGFDIQGKKNANARGSARGGGGDWAQMELTDAL